MGRIDSFALLSTLLRSVRGEEVLEIEFSDHILDKRVSEGNVVELDGGLLGDEIHLTFSFLKNYHKAITSSWSLREMPLTGPFSILFIK